MKHLPLTLLVLFVLNTSSLIAQSESVIDASGSTTLMTETSKPLSKWNCMLTWTPLPSLNLLNPSVQFGVQQRLKNNLILTGDLGYLFDYTPSDRGRIGLFTRLEVKRLLNSSLSYGPEKYLSFSLRHKSTRESFNGYHSAIDNSLYEQYMASFRSFHKTTLALNYGDIFELDSHLFIDISLGLGLNIIQVNMSDKLPESHTFNSTSLQNTSLGGLDTVIDFGTHYTPSLLFCLKICYKLN